MHFCPSEHGLARLFNRSKRSSSYLVQNSSHHESTRNPRSRTLQGPLLLLRRRLTGGKIPPNFRPEGQHPPPPLAQEVNMVLVARISNTFDTIKLDISNMVIFHHCNVSLQLRVTADASHHGLGASLEQLEPDGSRYPFVYASRFLSPREAKYSTNEFELPAVFWGLEHFRHYISGLKMKSSQITEPWCRFSNAAKTMKPFILGLLAG